MKKIKRMRGRLSEKLDIPEDTLGECYRLQLIGEHAILSAGRKILKYKSEEIVVLTKEGTVSFYGEHLKCIYFFEGTVEICGEIREIRIDKR